MIRRSTLALVAAVAAFFPHDLVAKSPPLPERLVVAEYVALGIDLGDRIVAAEALIGEAWRATPRERVALEEIRQRLERWDRYIVVNRLAEAELLLVVRQGRRGGVGGGGGAGGGVQPAHGTAFSSPDDMLAVYDAGGSPRMQLWQMLVSDGLSGEIALFEAFRADVERAAARRKRP